MVPPTAKGMSASLRRATSSARHNACCVMVAPRGSCFRSLPKCARTRFKHQIGARSRFDVWDELVFEKGRFNYGVALRCEMSEQEIHKPKVQLRHCDPYVAPLGYGVMLVISGPVITDNAHTSSTEIWFDWCVACRHLAQLSKIPAWCLWRWLGGCLRVLYKMRVSCSACADWPRALQNTCGVEHPGVFLHAGNARI